MISEYHDSTEFRHLRESHHQIRICIRKRPPNKTEVGRKEVDVISLPSKNQMVVHEPKHKVGLTKFLREATL
jgi:kinesin family protein 2/24